MKTFTVSPCFENENNYLNLNRRSRGVRKRHRTHFTPDQVEKLEEIFTQQTSNPYRELIVHLSTTLNLTDKNIAIWFKNRRAKERRQLNETENQKASNPRVSRETTQTQHNRQMETTLNSQSSRATSQYGERTLRSQQFSSETATITCPPNVTMGTFNPWNNQLPRQPEYQPYFTQPGWRLPQNIPNGFPSTQNIYQQSQYSSPLPTYQVGLPVMSSALPSESQTYTTKTTHSSMPLTTNLSNSSNYDTVNSHIGLHVNPNALINYGSPYPTADYSYYPKFRSATPISEKLATSPVNSSTGSSPIHHSFDSVNSVSSLPKELIDFVTSETLGNKSNVSSPKSTGSDEHVTKGQDVTQVSLTDYTFPSLHNLAF